MESSSFDLHGVSFCFTFGAYHLCFGQTSSSYYFSFRQTTCAVCLGITNAACPGRISLTLCFENQSLAFGLSTRLNTSTFSFSSFP